MAKHRDSENSRKERTIYQKKKKQYLRPELIIYGHIEKLTEGTGTNPGDSGTKTRA